MKYHNKKTQIDGITFDSKKEAERYRRLKTYEKNGIVHNIDIQVGYNIEVNGKLICKYIADFVYTKDGQTIVEDCKGVKTPVYNLKKKLMLSW